MSTPSLPTSLLLLLSLAVPGVGEELASPALEAVEKAVTAEMSRVGIPGLSLAIVAGGELRLVRGFGLADLENDVPATESTVYRLGSVSKPLTATAVMQLWEEGRLDLDAPVQKYVPSFPEKPWPITARELLGHLGGIRHYAPTEFGNTRHYGSLTEALSIFKADPILEPRTKFLYSTYGYTLLGCAVEGASGKRFADYLRERIFEPSAMERSRSDDVFELIPHRAHGYTRNGAGELQNSGLADTSYKIPGGGLCSTAADLGRFVIALQKGTLLKRETLEAMFEGQKTRDGKPTGYGLGWETDSWKERREAFHAGGQQRVSTLLYMRPQERFAVIVLANLESSGKGLVALARRISEILEP
jgi:serine beta-lactamase-like protein LACTB